MTDQTTGFQVAADINSFEASMRRLVDSARDGQAGVAGAFGQLEGIRNLFLGIGAAIGAIKFAEFVTGTLEAAGGLKDLSQKTGMTVESLSGMQSIAKLSGTSLDTIAGASNKLAFSLSSATEESKGASAAIEALGIDFKTFNALSPEDRLLAVSKAMSEFKDGTGKSAVAMALFGKAGAEMLPFLNDLAEAGQLNYKVTTEQANAADNFGDNLVKLSANTSAWQKTLVYGLAPALSDLSTALVDVFQQAGGLKDQIGRLSEEGKLELWARQATILVTYLSDAISLVVNVVGTAILAIGTPMMQLIRITYGLFDALSKLLTLNFSGFVDAISNAFSEASIIGRKNYEDLVSLWSGPTLGQRVRASLAKPKDESDSVTPKKDLNGFENVSGKGAKEPSQMPVYEAELAKKIELFEKAAQAEGTLRQFSKAEEAAYWKEVSTRVGLSVEDKARAEKKWRDLERTLRTDSFAVEMADIEQRKQAAQNNFSERIRLAEQAHAKTVAMYGAESKEAAATYGKILEEKRKLVQQQIQLDNIASGIRRDKALADIESDRQDADYQLNMGLITKQQLLLQEMQFQEQMKAIKKQALQESLALINPKEDPVKAAEIKAQIEQLETQHQLRIGAIKRQVMAADAGPMQNVFGAMESSFSDAVTGMITKGETLRQSLANIFKNVYTVFVQEMVSKPLAMAAMRVIRESMLYKTLAGAQVASQGAASGAVVGIKAGEAGAVVASNAAEASSGAAAAVAPTPFIGPALAVAAALAMMSFVMGMKGGSGASTTTRIPSASRGFDIPRGLNPMTQLHEEEMVLPAHIANPLRDSLAQGATDGQGGGQGGTVVIHTTGGDFIHKRDLAKVLTAMKRDFKFA